MDISKIGIGEDPPHDVNVLIEIPQGGVPVKYELDKDSGALRVDRFLNTAMFYPGNYGFIPHTLSGDGDPVDVLVITPYALTPGVVVTCRPLGVLMMDDEAGGDAKLLAVPARVLWLSCEPLLGPIELSCTFPATRDLPWYGVKGWNDGPFINWVIVGGESGPGARPMKPDWVREVRDQCMAAGVKFFFKQWGGFRPKSGGRMLNGKEWNEFPKLPSSCASPAILYAAAR